MRRGERCHTSWQIAVNASIILPNNFVAQPNTDVTDLHFVVRDPALSFPPPH